MAHTFRGGRPWNRTLSVTTAGVIGINGDANSVQAAGNPYNFPAITSELQLEVTSGSAVDLYWSEAEYLAGINAMHLVSGKPKNVRATASQFWLKALDGPAVLEVTGLSRV